MSALVIGTAVVVAIASVVVAAAALLDRRRLESRARALLAIAERADAHAGARGEGLALLEEAIDAARRHDADATRLRLALDAVTDAVLVVRADGVAVARNSAAERFHEARHADALAEDAIAELVERALGGEAGERELRLYGPPRRVLLVRAFPLVHEHTIVGAVALTRDVTHTRRVESVRRDFVANVSHELKTPIGALAVLAETMASGADPAIMQRLAERVSREADRLARIVDDLLDLSLVEAQETPTREPIPVALLVGEAIEDVSATADAAGVPVRAMGSLVNLEIACDRRQVVTALVNLLDNAVKYSEPGHPVEVLTRVADGRVVIDVCDHGIGIPTRDLERIFERFYRVDRARARDTGGTGLGLSIVRHVVQAHGGEVTVSSREGEGSVFSLTLPLGAGTARDLSEAS
ncbi:MAG TPA: ATP-binding protein [Acidimicrobiia bacterium]|nr:ATP-binding protein [Acidimicrobiia bacterium]